MEVQIAPPPYIVHTGSTVDGNGDSALFVKFRAFSAPEGAGDYFVGFFFGASFPSGTPPNGAGHTILSPMLALAKVGVHSAYRTPSAAISPQAAPMFWVAHFYGTRPFSMVSRAEFGQ
jgi:hypothetical protein